MNDVIDSQRLEDVLDEYVASETGPHSPELADWISRYPEYERELTEFAASWSLMNSLPPAPDAEQVDAETLVLRGMSVVQNLLHMQQRTQPQTLSANVVPFQSLLAEGRARGLEPRQLARITGVGDTLLRKLDRRLIRHASIPREIVEALAAAIQRATDSVDRYLQQGPTFAAAARYRAEQAPQLGEPEDFFSAARSDPTMSDEQRARWLALEDR